MYDAVAVLPVPVQWQFPGLNGSLNIFKQG